MDFLCRARQTQWIDEGVWPSLRSVLLQTEPFRGTRAHEPRSRSEHKIFLQSAAHA